MAQQHMLIRGVATCNSSSFSCIMAAAAALLRLLSPHAQSEGEKEKRTGATDLHQELPAGRACGLCVLSFSCWLQETERRHSGAGSWGSGQQKPC